MFKKIALGLFVTIFFTGLFALNVSADGFNKGKETVTKDFVEGNSELELLESDDKKGNTSEFYIEIRSEIEKLYFQVDNSEITEEEFVEKIEQGIAQQFQSERDIDNLIESENKSNFSFCK